MKNYKYIFHLISSKERPTLVNVINYGILTNNDKLKILTKNGYIEDEIKNIENSNIKVINFNDIDFEKSLWKWRRKNNNYNKITIDESITMGEIYKDDFWNCFKLMIIQEENVIKIKPMLI